MEGSNLLVNTVFNSTSTSRKDFIPIRSFIYRKSTEALAVNKPKISQSQHTSPRNPFAIPNTMFKPIPDPLDIAKQVSFKDQSLKLPPAFHDTMSVYKSMSTQDMSLKNNAMRTSFDFHKLSKGSSRATVRSPQRKELNSRARLKPLERSVQKSPEPSISKDDYMNILFDEKRKRFLKEEYEGTFDFSQEQVMGRIYNMAFREPTYFSTRSNYQAPVEIPDENIIRERFQFKLPAVISNMENDKAPSIHVLGGSNVDLKHMEVKANKLYVIFQNLLEAAKDQLAKSRGQKEVLLAEMRNMKKTSDDELEELGKYMSQRMKQIDEVIRNDVVFMQNEGYRMQKEITLLQREKLALEKECVKAQEKLQLIEMKLYGKQMFNLEPNIPELDALSDINLRSEARVTMSNFPIIH